MSGCMSASNHHQRRLEKKNRIVFVLLRQYLYLFTSKAASSASVFANSGKDVCNGVALRLLRLYCYFCITKAASSASVFVL